MRIVDYETFIRMPSGTIFAPWTPCTTLEEPEIKVDHGWEYTDDSGNARWMFDGTCVVMPRPVECDGFDFGECESEFFYYEGDSTDASEYKMFLIYEEDDINNIIKILEWAKKGCPGDGPEQALRGEK